MDEKRNINPLLPILSILLVVVSALCIFLWIQKSEAEKRAESYQASYNQLVSYMLDDAAMAENLGNLIISVWNNAIWSVDDSETDPYTKFNGEFVSDFNDALGNLFNDEEFNQNASALASNQQQVRDEMKGMVNPPEEYASAYKALENMYNAYISFTDTVLRCEGSLESFSNEFADADDKFIEFYHLAELYVK